MIIFIYTHMRRSIYLYVRSPLFRASDNWLRRQLYHL